MEDMLFRQGIDAQEIADLFPSTDEKMANISLDDVSPIEDFVVYDLCFKEDALTELTSTTVFDHPSGVDALEHSSDFPHLGFVADEGAENSNLIESSDVVNNAGGDLVSKISSIASDGSIFFSNLDDGGLRTMDDVDAPTQDNKVNLSTVEEPCSSSNSQEDDKNDSSSDEELTSSSSAEEEESCGLSSSTGGNVGGVGETVELLKDELQSVLQDDIDSDSDKDEVPCKGRFQFAKEIEVLPLVPQISVSLEPHHQMVQVGVVTSILGVKVIVEGSVKHCPLNEGSVLWIMEGRFPLGIVDETFGPVKNPFYIVRYNSEEEVPVGIGTGTQVSFVPEFANCIFNMEAFYKKGYDASGENDEEINDEVEFSDDEKEAEYRRSLRQAKRPPNDGTIKPGKQGFTGGHNKRTHPPSRSRFKREAKLEEVLTAPATEVRPPPRVDFTTVSSTSSTSTSSFMAPSIQQSPISPLAFTAHQALQLSALASNPLLQLLVQQTSNTWRPGASQTQLQNMPVQNQFLLGHLNLQAQQQQQNQLLNCLANSIQSQMQCVPGLGSPAAATANLPWCGPRMDQFSGPSGIGGALPASLELNTAQQMQFQPPREVLGSTQFHPGRPSFRGGRRTPAGRGGGRRHGPRK